MPHETSNGTTTQRAYRPEELRALIERESRSLLGVSTDEAFAMLERGELDGTFAGVELKMLRAVAS